MLKFKKKILFITEDFPSGLNGTSVKTRSTLKYLLEEGYRIDVCCFHFDKFQVRDIKHDNLEIHAVKAKRLNKKSLYFLFYLVGLIISYIPLSIRRLYSINLQKVISNLFKKNNYDVVIFDGYSTLQYLDKNFFGKSIYIDDEDFTDLYRQRFILEKNYFKKLFYIFEYLKSLLYERSSITKVSQVWAISPRTKLRLKKISKRPTVLMPTFIPLKKYLYANKGYQIVFTGTLNWRENVEGLKWFIKNNWNKILLEFPKASLAVIGQGASQQLISFLNSYKNIQYKGYVESLEEEYSKSVLAIAPVRINAGIKVKILTYMSYGIPVISTKKAAWGLVSKNGVEVVSDAKFFKKVIQLLNNKEKLTVLSKQASLNIKSNYSKKVLHNFFVHNLKL